MDAAVLVAPHNEIEAMALAARAREIDPSGTTLATGERCSTRLRTR